MQVDDADAHCAHARAAGAKIIEEPATHDYGEVYWSDRNYRAEDLEGHQWWFTHRCKLVGSTQLASGPFAMIDDGLGFQLVPWQPVLDQRVGQHITGTLRGGGIEWSFGRKRGLGL